MALSWNKDGKYEEQQEVSMCVALVVAFHKLELKRISCRKGISHRVTLKMTKYGARQTGLPLTFAGPGWSMSTNRRLNTICLNIFK